MPADRRNALNANSSDLVTYYDQLASRYDVCQRRWLRFAGGEAQAALEAAARTFISGRASLLDAGCGSGAFVRRLVADHIPPSEITLLDSSDAMLARCTDVPAQRIRGRLESLPFDDCAFDIVTCAWALETVLDMDLALSELCRVVRRGGLLCLTFCADQPSRSPSAWLMRKIVTWRGSGRFLPKDDVVETVRCRGDFRVTLVPSRGPAVTVLARRAEAR